MKLDFIKKLLGYTIERITIPQLSEKWMEDFSLIYESVRSRVFMELIDRSVIENRKHITKEEMKNALNDFSDGYVNTLIKAMNESQDFSIFSIELDLEKPYELLVFVIDKPILNPSDDKECDGLFISNLESITRSASYRDKTPETIEMIVGSIILSSNATGFRKENRTHIIEHEITHMVLDYLYRMKIIDEKTQKEFIEPRNEFLADFLPFYVRKDQDYLCNFLEYGVKWFDTNILDKYREIIKKIVLELNQE